MEAVIPSRAANSSRWHVHFWKLFPRLSNRSMGCGGEGTETGRHGQNKCCREDGEIHLITCESLCIWCSAWELTTTWCQEIQLWHPGKELCKAAWLSEAQTALTLTASHYFSQNAQLLLSELYRWSNLSVGRTAQPLWFLYLHLEGPECFFLKSRVWQSCLQ